MKKAAISLYIIFLILTQYHLLQAQNIYYINKKIIESLDNLATLKMLDAPPPVNYNGSPYANEGFIRGDIFYDINWKYPDIPLRYNIFNDEMEFKIEGRETVYALGPDKRIQQVIIQKDTFVVAGYSEKGKRTIGFFRELVKGKIELLARHQVEFLKERPSNGIQDAEPAKFIRSDDQYYIRRKSETAEKLTSIKKLIESIGDHQKELKEYSNKHKISKGNESELIQFISYYNSLDPI